ncbi:hypothetical protein LTR27_006095 [Elasticomyces elasticus]|nr:hypothetical protein LTR27_006095 [Elasticomyces elasticus]
MDFTALFHALLLILSIPNKALNSLNSLLNAYPRTIGSPSPPPVITAIAYRNLPAVSTACTFEAHGTTSPTYAAVTGQLDNVMPTSYNLADAAPTTSLYTESHESSELVVYEMPTARHSEYPTIINNAVCFWLLNLIVVYLVGMWANSRCEVLALRHRCSVYEALQRSVREQNDGLVKEKLTALTTIEKEKLAAINLRIKFGETSRLEVLCDNFRAQIRENDLLLSQAGDELTRARSKHAVVETQNGELEKRVMRYEEEATNLRKTAKEKSEALEEAEKDVKELKENLDKSNKTVNKRNDKITKQGEALKKLQQEYDAEKLNHVSQKQALDEALQNEQATKQSLATLQHEFIAVKETFTEQKQQLEDAVEKTTSTQRSLAALQQGHLEDQEKCDELEAKYGTLSEEIQARDGETAQLKQEKATLLLEVTARDTKIDEMEAKRRASLQVLQDARLQKSAEQKQRDQAVVAELAAAKLANATLVESMQAAEIEIGRLQEQARVQFDAYASLQAEYTASSQNSATESMDTAAEFQHAVVYDIDDFARTTVPFSVGCIDDSSASTIACMPFGPSVTVRLPPPGPPKVEADASAMCSSVKSDDDAEVSDQCSDGDTESSSNSGESGYVSGSQQASGSTDTIYHNAPAESEQHETQVDSGGEDSIATLRDPSFAALELRQESVSCSNDTTYDSASAAGEQREVGVYGGGEASIATPRDPSPASVEPSLARTDTIAGSERSDLGNECASSDGFAASHVTDTELDVKKKRNRRSRRGGTGRLHETLEEGTARRAALKKPLRRGGHNQRSRGLKSANMW